MPHPIPPPGPQIRAKLDRLQLTAADVVAEEHARVARSGDMDSPVWVKLPFFALCWVLDVMYENKPIEVGQWGSSTDGKRKS